MKLSKRDLKEQEKILDLLNSDKLLTMDDREYIYENFNPGIINDVTSGAVFFTPIGLAQDVAVFSHKYGNIIDLCSGIGMLTYKLLCNQYYEPDIKSITLIEYNNQFLNISRRLLTGMTTYNTNRTTTELNFVNGNMFDQNIWTSITTGTTQYDFMVSNPPYGTATRTDKELASTWLKYSGERELMAIELCLKYSKGGMFIIPPNSCGFQYSGRHYFKEEDSTKVKKLRTAIEKPFIYYCDGIDTAIYKDEWKNTNITVECAGIYFEENY